MGIRRFLLLSLSTLLLSEVSHVKAASSGQGLPPVRRLFGVELGTRVTEYRALGQGIVETAGYQTPHWIQPIDPPEKNTLFERYEVTYNPESLEIYQISARSQMSESQCISLLPVLYEEISKKYQGYKILQGENYIVVDWRKGGYGLLPYQIQCRSDELRIWVFDEDASAEHAKNNKNRSPISPSGL